MKSAILLLGFAFSFTSYAGIEFQYPRSVTNSRQEIYTIAQQFGALHGGVGQFSEGPGINGILESLGFVTGDQMSCRIYLMLPTFPCTSAGKTDRYYTSTLRKRPVWR